ncbi:MAG TPA: TonB-dependent receptor, partial [Bacteroidota bacterium]|nr:TonB-dependent receptor [Bacteroidota bacterium]
KISGKIADAQTKEALPSVNVVVVGTQLGGASDIDGEYFILNIPPGTYQVKASAVGYSPVVIGNVRVTADQTTRVLITLQAQSVELGEVVVAATRPIVQKDLTSTVASVGSDQIAKLPLEDVAAVVNLQAGVVEGHFRGGRSGEVKYLVDGVSVNDVFSGESSMEAELNSIAEIQVLSGTFNAEYGEALSGVVNQITKVAADHYTGEISAYTGGYFSGRSSLFPHIDRVDPSTLYNFQGSISGPVIGNVLKFFASGKYLYDAGYIYGRRVFNPRDSSNFSANNPSEWHIGATGDGAYVPMNDSKRYTVQGKLSVDLGGAKDLSINGMFQNHDYRIYDHQFRLDPDGDYTYHQKGYLGSASYTAVFSDAAFLDLSGSYFRTEYKQYVFPNPTGPGDLVIDPGYVDPTVMQQAGANAFLTGGTQNWHFNHTSTTWTGKADMTAQVSSVHQVKAGAEVRLNHLQYTDYQIIVSAATNEVPTMPQPGAFDFNVYDNHPYQLALYAQDKIELDYLVVNVGVRWDYFQPDANVLLNADSIAALDNYNPSAFPPQYFRKATVKQQVSPRIGISYPISEKGAVHLSYGHFFQIPAFDFLYKNPNERIALTGVYPDFVGNTIGNADLQPQRTTMYEIGLQQQIGAELGITVTGYYKDIRNLLALQIHVKNNFAKFGEYINQDYGAVQGFTFSLEKRLTNGFGVNLDYTFQVAKGDASDPNDAYNKVTASPPIDVNKELVPLAWDRRHSLNVTLTFGTPDDFIASVIGRAGSGLPYTPSLQNQRTGLENSDNMPGFYNFDLYMTKYLKLPGDFRLSVFLKVYNLFDTANEINVFGDTGRAGYTLALTQQQPVVRGDNTLAQYYTRPDFYSAPRQVILGAAFSF